MATLVIRVSADVDPTTTDPLDLAVDLMALYDEDRKHNDDQLSTADLGAEFLEAEWED